MLAHALLLALSLGAAPTPTDPIDQIVSLLAEQKYEDAFLLVSQVRMPNPPLPARRQSAQAIARGAAECRANDAMVALSLSALASRLAPTDPDVLLTHAETLLAVKELGEAAAVLDRVIKAQPAKSAPRAWFLRASLAHEEGEEDLAIRLLMPLSADSPMKDQAALLLTDALAARKQRRAAQKALADVARPIRVAPAAADREEKARDRHPSGTLIESFPGTISLGGRSTFTVRGLSKGQTYLFRATGSCEREARRIRNPSGCVIRVQQNPNEAFGVDFRVQFDAQPSRALGVGQRKARDENKIEFVATGERMTIQVFDESHADEEVRCTMGGFSVVAQ